MESQERLVDRGDDLIRHQMQQFDGAEIASYSSEVGLNLDGRPTVSALQVPCRPKVVTKPIASSSLLPPLSALKSGKTCASHEHLPRLGLRSRASLEKNLNTIFTGTERGASDSFHPTLPGLPVAPLWNKRTSSLPVRTNALTSDSNKGDSHEIVNNLHCEPGYDKAIIVRSFSTPVFVNKLESFRRDGSGRTSYVLVRSASPRKHTVQPSRENESVDAVNYQTSVQFDAEKGKGVTKEEVEEAIPEEEAVCRICMDSLSEDFGETLKMECCCRGEMALAHKECAFKWFGIKGDRVCEVCGSVVSNIPVTVIRFPVQETINYTRSFDTHTIIRTSVWQDSLFMGIVNTMAYFCYMEQLLVNKLGTRALAISMPFSVIIGLLASVTTIALVDRCYIWLYASIQFVLVCFFGYVFFFETQIEAVLAVILAAFAGFGVAMTSNALVTEYIHWKQHMARRVQSTTNAMDVGVTRGELAASQWSRELGSSRTSLDLDIESGSVNARSPSSRIHGASEGLPRHYS